MAWNREFGAPEGRLIVAPAIHRWVDRKERYVP